jgi:competence protein ComEC
MVSSAWFALAVLCVVQLLPALPEVLLIPELAVSCILLTWLVWGGRASLALVPGLWALFGANWAIDDRLDPRLAGQDIMIQGTICDIPRVNPLVRRFMLESASAVPGLPHRLFISWYEANEIPRGGEYWQFKVRLKRPRGLSNPGGFDFERWAYRQGIGATGYIRDSVLNRRISSDSADCRLTGLRQRIAGRLQKELAGQPYAGHLLALSVGVRSELTPADWSLLRRTGTIHLMAISGLHVGLVAVFMHFFGGQIGRLLLLTGVQTSPLVIGRACAAAGAVGYAALAGFSVPTVRAMVMVLVTVAFLSLRRYVSPWQILASALVVVLMVDPAAPLSTGFWLSFYAVGLLLLKGLEVNHHDGENRSRFSRALERTSILARMQIVLAIGLGPLSTLFFDQISLIAPVSNLIVVPMFALVIVPLTLFGTVSLWISGPLAGVVLQAAALVMGWALEILTWLDRLPLTVWHPPPMSGAAIAMIIVSTLVLLWPRPVPGRLSVVALLIAAIAGSMSSGDPKLRVVVMDVGQGLAVLIQTSGHALVFDTGPAYRTRDAGQSVVLPMLRYFGVRKLDTVVISHGDSDHRGGVKSVLAGFPDAVLMAPARVEIEGISHVACEAGLTWVWDSIEFRFLHPEPGNRDADWSENDDSCVLLVRSARTGILLPGDIEGRAEAYLTARGLIPEVDLVVAPHHGSKSSSSKAFVAATAPRYVVFSAGHRNRWGFPADPVSARWRNAGGTGMTTAESGAIVFETDRVGRLTLQRRQRLDSHRIWTETSDY